MKVSLDSVVIPGDFSVKPQGGCPRFRFGFGLVVLVLQSEVTPESNGKDKEKCDNHCSQLGQSEIESVGSTERFITPG